MMFIEGDEVYFIREVMEDFDEIAACVVNDNESCSDGYGVLFNKYETTFKLCIHFTEILGKA